MGKYGKIEKETKMKYIQVDTFYVHSDFFENFSEFNWLGFTSTEKQQILNEYLTVLCMVSCKCNDF